MSSLMGQTIQKDFSFLTPKEIINYNNECAVPLSCCTCEDVEWIISFLEAIKENKGTGMHVLSVYSDQRHNASKEGADTDH